MVLPFVINFCSDTDAALVKIVKSKSALRPLRFTQSQQPRQVPSCLNRRSPRVIMTNTCAFERNIGPLQVAAHKRPVENRPLPHLKTHITHLRIITAVGDLPFPLINTGRIGDNHTRCVKGNLWHIKFTAGHSDFLGSEFIFCQLPQLRRPDINRNPSGHIEVLHHRICPKRLLFFEIVVNLLGPNRPPPGSHHNVPRQINRPHIFANHIFCLAPRTAGSSPLDIPNNRVIGLQSKRTAFFVLFLLQTEPAHYRYNIFTLCRLSRLCLQHSFAYGSYINRIPETRLFLFRLRRGRPMCLPRATTWGRPYFRRSFRPYYLCRQFRLRHTRLPLILNGFDRSKSLYIKLKSARVGDLSFYRRHKNFPPHIKPNHHRPVFFYYRLAQIDCPGPFAFFDRYIALQIYFYLLNSGSFSFQPYYGTVAEKLIGPD